MKQYHRIDNLWVCNRCGFKDSNRSDVQWHCRQHRSRMKPVSDETIHQVACKLYGAGLLRELNASVENEVGIILNGSGLSEMETVLLKVIDLKEEVKWPLLKNK